MFKNEMRSYVRIGGRGLKNLTYPYMWVGGVKNCQNHPYVINKWPQRRLKKRKHAVHIPWDNSPLDKIQCRDGRRLDQQAMS